MSDKTATSFFMLSPLVSKYAGLYQELLKGFGGYRHLGNRLIRLGEQAHAFRQFDRVREIGQLLSNIPIKDYQAIGHYFEAVAANSMGNGDQEKARKLFEIVANTAPDEYKGKAIMSLAAIAAHKRDYVSELYFFQESLKAGEDLYTILKAHKGIAVIQAREGYHKQSLKYLETFLPLIRYAEPHVYFDYLNSYAVELGEANRKNEARNVIKHVVASPFDFAYPEWQETARDLKEPSRTFISVPHIKHEPIDVQSIQAHPASKEARPNRPRRLIPFPPLREAPKPTRPNRVTPEEFGEMTADERVELVLAAIRSGEVRESDYIKLVMSLGLLASGPASKVIDLKDEAVLDDIVSVWCNMIEPEEFASVMSALRDCKDDLTRETIMDNMITIAFKQTPASMQTEQEWRLRVGRKLPDK
ncbi:MAG TPA: hypothetical protein VNI02_00570 [Blastocatellia bacterium]|nr:hypothetical protein [Blastocatellia bacterium]